MCTVVVTTNLGGSKRQNYPITVQEAKSPKSRCKDRYHLEMLMENVLRGVSFGFGVLGLPQLQSSLQLHYN